MVAVLAHEAPQPLAFAAEHEGDRPLAVDLVPPLGARRVEADDPDPARLHGLERLHEVAAAGHAHVLEPARGGAGHGLGQARGVPLGQHHAVGARGFGGPQDGAQVPRVFDPVEDHDEGGIARGR